MERDESFFPERSPADRRRIRAEVLYDLETECRRQGFLADPDLVYDEGRNVLVGGNGGDCIYGHGRLQGGSGDDYISGAYIFNEGVSREITGGGGNDRIRSYSDVDDTIGVRDNERDTVACGPGTDKVFFDRGIDSVNPLGCEERIGG